MTLLAKQTHAANKYQYSYLSIYMYVCVYVYIAGNLLT